MKFFISKSSSTSSKPLMLKITSEDFCHFKETKQNMKEQKKNATDMFLKTSETIYQITVEVASRAIHMLEKVMRRGVCEYKVGSKTDRLIASYNKTHEEYKEMLLKIEIKLEPAKADFFIECWLKKDAAQKAAQEHKERRKEQKDAKNAASAAVEKYYVNFPIEEETEVKTVLKPKPVFKDFKIDVVAVASKSEWCPEPEMVEYFPGYRVSREFFI